MAKCSCTRNNNLAATVSHALTALQDGQN